MRRFGHLHRAVLPLLLLASAGSLVAGCSDDSEDPATASLAELVAEQENYEGRRVETVGVVRRFGEAEGATRLHYVVEDQQANRMALIPNDLAARHAGEEVVVVGSFRFSERDGRSIEIERIQPRGASETSMTFQPRNGANSSWSSSLRPMTVRPEPRTFSEAPFHRTPRSKR